MTFKALEIEPPLQEFQGHQTCVFQIIRLKFQSLDSNEFLTSTSIILSGYQPFSVADYYITAYLFSEFLKSVSGCTRELICCISSIVDFRLVAPSDKAAITILFSYASKAT
jgi:hypothetical protein